MAFIIAWLFVSLNIYGDALSEYRDFRIGMGDFVASWHFSHCDKLELFQSSFSGIALNNKQRKFIKWKIKRLEFACAYEVSAARQKVMLLLSTDPFSTSQLHLQMGDNMVPSPSGQWMGESSCESTIHSKAVLQL